VTFEFIGYLTKYVDIRGGACFVLGRTRRCGFEAGDLIH
jgi:hypothetical protein